MKIIFYQQIRFLGYDIYNFCIFIYMPTLEVTQKIIIFKHRGFKLSFLNFQHCVVFCRFERNHIEVPNLRNVFSWFKIVSWDQWIIYSLRILQIINMEREESLNSFRKMCRMKSRVVLVVLISNKILWTPYA